MDSTEKAVVVVQKKWWASKTVWFNALTFVSMLGMIINPAKLSPNGVAIVGTIVAVANVALRLWFTGAPVTDTGAVAAESGGNP